MTSFWSQLGKRCPSPLSLWFVIVPSKCKTVRSICIIQFWISSVSTRTTPKSCKIWDVAGMLVDSFQTKFVVRKDNFFFWKGLVNQPAPPIPPTTPQQLVGGTYICRDPQCVPEKLINFPFVLETYLTFPGLKTSHKDGTQRRAFSPVLSLLWVSVIDLESPVVESGWKHFDPNANFLLRKSWDTFLFAKLLGWTTGGVLDCRGLVFGWHGKLALMSVSKQGWFRFAKSEDKFIWQMFSMEDCLWSSWAEQKYCKHGILHVILRGPQRWQATWFRQSTLFEDVSSDVGRKVSVFYLAADECTKSMYFLAMTWPWWNKKYVQLGRSFWAWRSRFHQVVFPLTKLATNCSWRARHRVYCCGLPGQIMSDVDSTNFWVEYFVDNIF